DLKHSLKGLDYIVAALLLAGVGLFVWRHVKRWMDLAARDAQLYSAITTATAGSRLIAVLVVVIAWINWNGLVWWLIGLLLSRSRGFSRRGRLALLTLYIGMVDGWLVSEILKLVFRRPRPLLQIVDAPVTLIDHPASFSFPSGDATSAVGARGALRPA